MNTIQFLGRLRPVYFGMPAIEYVTSKGVYEVFGQVGETGSFEVKDFKTIVHFVYGALKGGCEYRDEPEDFTYSDVYEEMEKITISGDENKVLETVSRAFSESTVVKEYAKKNKKKEEVKPIGKKLKKSLSVS